MTGSLSISEIEAASAPDVVGFLRGRDPERVAGTDPGSQIDVLRWWIGERPAAPDPVPAGWLLRRGDDVVGCLLAVGRPLVVAGETRTICLGSTFFVDEAERGSGGVLFGRLLRLARRMPVAGLSCNVASAAIWRDVGGRPVPGSEIEWLGVLRPGRVLGGTKGGVRAMAARLVPPVGRLAARAGRHAEAARLDPSALDEADLPRPPSEAEVVVPHDLGYFRWRYGGPGSAALYRISAGPHRPVFFGTERAQRANGLRVLVVHEVWGEANDTAVRRSLGGLVRTAGEDADLVVVRGVPATSSRALLASGFFRRRRSVPAGWFLDKTDRPLPTGSWAISAADGEPASAAP